MSEMEKLAVMLYGAGIEAVRVVEEADGIVRTNQILVEAPWKSRLSAICHRGSYGCEQGLIEVWNFSAFEQPVGWLTASEAFAWFCGKLGIGGGDER